MEETREYNPISQETAGDSESQAQALLSAPVPDERIVGFDAPRDGDASAPCNPVEPVAAAPQPQEPNVWRPKGNMLVIGIVSGLICFFAGWAIFANNYDNDVWFFLATGREILENGIPHTNPFAVFDDMQIVVQQWLHCVIVYLLYSAGGFVATGFWTMFLFAAFIVSAFVLARKLRGNAEGTGWVLILVALAAYSMSAYMAIRPHLYSMLAFVWIVYFMEQYRGKNNWMWLIPVPFIVALHVNLQSAIVPFDIAIMVCYAIPDVLPKLHDIGVLEKVSLASSGYRRLPLLVAIGISAVATLANPYLLDGALYVVNSYGTADYGGYISEMGALAPAGMTGSIVMLCLAFAAAACMGRRGLGNINLPLVLLFLVSVYMAFDHTRNLWLCGLFSFMFIVWATAGVSIASPCKWMSSKLALIVPVVLGVVASVAFVIINIPELEELPPNNAMTPVDAMDYLDEAFPDKEDIDVFTFFNSGGYIEYRGFKVNMDPRPELWAPGISGQDFDYYVEYIDMSTGEVGFDVYIEKYDFDAFVIPKNEAAADYLEREWDYVSIPSGDDYSAFVKRSLVSHDASGD